MPENYEHSDCLRDEKTGWVLAHDVGCSCRPVSSTPYAITEEGVRRWSELGWVSEDEAVRMGWVIRVA